jgi:translation initiation factor IF-3
VRVIGPDGDQLGVLSIEEARDKAAQLGLDLVEVAPQARPVVCKIMDHGRFLYEQEKKAKEARRNQHEIEVKEVKLRPGIDSGDFDTKLKMAERFLSKGNKVKVTVMFRRREMRRPENGYQLLARVVEQLAQVAEVEQAPPPQLEGRDLTMVLRQAR